MNLQLQTNIFLRKYEKATLNTSKAKRLENNDETNPKTKTNPKNA